MCLSRRLLIIPISPPLVNLSLVRVQSTYHPKCPSPELSSGSSRPNVISCSGIVNHWFSTSFSASLSACFSKSGFTVRGGGMRLSDCRSMYSSVSRCIISCSSPIHRDLPTLREASEAPAAYSPSTLRRTCAWYSRISSTGGH